MAGTSIHAIAIGQLTRGGFLAFPVRMLNSRVLSVRLVRDRMPWITQSTWAFQYNSQDASEDQAPMIIKTGFIPDPAPRSVKTWPALWCYVIGTRREPQENRGKLSVGQA